MLLPGCPLQQGGPSEILTLLQPSSGCGLLPLCRSLLSARRAAR
jgi:hypothetical protein